MLLVRTERLRVWRPRVVVEKWDLDQVAAVAHRLDAGPRRAPALADFRRFGVRPVESVEVEGNLVTDAGLARVASLMTGSGGQALTATATRVGVGDGSGTVAGTDTDLFAAAGATHRYFQPVDSIDVTDELITVVATFSTANGNFTWNEYGWDIGTPTVTGGTTVNAVLLNHKAGLSGTLGTKTSSYAWAFTSYNAVGG
jgi:hypothetical protein